MVKDDSDCEKGNPLPPHRLLLSIVTPVVEHWLEWEIAQWVHPPWRIDPTTHRTMSGLAS